MDVSNIYGSQQQQQQQQPLQGGPLDLPYPWTSQFDSNYQTYYFVNQQTGESRWTHPFETPEAAGNNATGQPAVGGGGGGGQAAAFYGNEGTSAPQQQWNGAAAGLNYGAPEAAGDPNAEPGERGIGKVVVGGAVLYMGYKMLKKFQNGGKHGHTGYGGAPSYGAQNHGYGYPQQQGYGYGGGGPGMMSSGPMGMFGGSAGSGLGSMLGFGKRDMVDDGGTGQNNSLPSSSQYGPPAIAPPIFGQQQDYNSAIPSYTPTPSPGPPSDPYAYQGGASNSYAPQTDFSAIPYSGQQTYADQGPAYKAGQHHSSGWGDPRY